MVLHFPGYSTWRTRGSREEALDKLSPRLTGIQDRGYGDLQIAAQELGQVARLLHSGPRKDSDLRVYAQQKFGVNPLRCVHSATLSLL